MREEALVLACCALLAAGCSGRPGVTPAATPVPPAAAEAAPQLTLLEGSGIDFKVTSGGGATRYILESLGTGVCLLDYDRDGWLDVFLVNGSTIELQRRGEAPGAALYRNQGDGTFRDVTAAARVPALVWGQGCAVGDVDNDGDPDLYVTAFGPNLLYRNNGDGTFTDASAGSGVADPRWSTSAVFLDYDRDGKLDLYVANYLRFDVDHPPEPAPTSELPLPSNLTFLDPSVRLFVGPLGLTPVHDGLYRGRGDGTFEDVSEASGILRVPPRFGLGVLAADLDDDGDQDLYVANDSVPNFLFVNQGDGTFVENGIASGAAVREDGASQASMGVAAGDVDGDGREDLFVSNFSEDYNTLYRNLGKGLLADVTKDLGLAPLSWTELGWGTGLADFDLDGDLDVFVANGHVYAQLQEGSARGSYRQRNQLLLNRGAAGFADVTAAAGSGLRPVWSSRGAAFGDLDNDGDVDVVVSNLDDGIDVLRNDTPRSGHWVAFQVEGSGRSSRDAAGARLRLVAGGRSLLRVERTGYSFLSASDPRLHFGLGPAERVDSLELRWPDGQVESFGPLAADRTWRLVEGGGAPVAVDLPRWRQPDAGAGRASVQPGADRGTGVPPAAPEPTLRPPAEAAGLAVPARLARAAELLRTGRVEEAMRWYEAVLAADPGNVDAHLTLAKIAYPAGELELAERHLRAAVRQAPERGDAHVQLGSYLYNRKLLAEAEAELKAGLKASPDDVFGHYLYGFVLADRNRHAEAVAEFDLALAGADRRAKALHQKALSLIKLDRLDEAVVALNQALREEPDLKGALYALKLIEARTGREGLLTPEQRLRLDTVIDRNQETSHQESVVRLQPSDAGERIKLAHVYDGAGRETDAARELREALRIDPRNSRAQVFLARILGRNRLFDEALGLLAEAEKAGPGAPPVRVERARILIAQGQVGPAAKELVAALEANPADLDASEELARLLVAAEDGDPVRALRWAKRARALGSKDVVTLARALRRAGEERELEALLAQEIPLAAGDVRQQLRDLETGAAAR